VAHASACRRELQFALPISMERINAAPALGFQQHGTQAIAAHLSGRPLVVRNVALVRKLASSLIPSTRQALGRKSFPKDGTLFRHDPCGSNVLAAFGRAGVVVAALRRGLTLGMYDPRALPVMGNHVHALLRPLGETSRALQWIKGTTAREANQLLARTGKPFWQRESYDHWVRDEREMERNVAYIENNPVTAGLASVACAFPWSSPWREDGELKFTAAR
jgi:hypothetical protein